TAALFRRRHSQLLPPQPRHDCGHLSGLYRTDHEGLANSLCAARPSQHRRGPRRRLSASASREACRRRLDRGVNLMPMTQRQALEVVQQHRGQRIVVTTMSAAGLWPQMSNSPLDFAYIPSAMGHGPSLGLGLALAHPEHGVIVLNGDGCTLMSLGNLVTLAHHPANI